MKKRSFQEIKEEYNKAQDELKKQYEKNIDEEILYRLKELSETYGKPITHERSHRKIRFFIDGKSFPKIEELNGISAVTEAREKFKLSKEEYREFVDIFLGLENLDFVEFDD